MNDPKNKDEALQLMTSLAKSFGIKNGDYLQAGSDFNLINDSNKQTICCLVWNEIIDKYNKTIRDRNMDPTAISGIRYYVTCQVKINGTFVLLNDACGYNNQVNFNKPGVATNYILDNRYRSENPSIDKRGTNNGHTYFNFSRPIIQDSKLNQSSMYNKLRFHYTLDCINSVVISDGAGYESALGEIKNYWPNKSERYNELLNKTYTSNNVTHTVHFQQIYVFIPCFKI